MTIHNSKLIPVICSIGAVLSSLPAWATPTFDFATYLLELPVVSVSGVGNFQTTLLLNGDSFVLQRIEVASDQAIAAESVPAEFSIETGTLSIPLVDIILEDGKTIPYAADLNLVKGSDPVLFNLTKAVSRQDPVNGVLRHFNIDTSATPRVAPDGNDLPANYSPLGASFEMNKTDELFLVGLAVNSTSSENSQAAFIELTNTNPGQTATFSTDVLNVPNPSDTPWAQNTVFNPSIAGTNRAATAADLDGNGLEETVVVYRINEAGAERIKISRFADKAGNFAVTDGGTLALADGVRDISVAAGDFDGNGTDEIVVALSKSDAVDILLVSYSDGVFSVDANAGKTLPATLSNASLYTSMETGNIDYDNPEEWAIVVTELSDRDTGISRYFVFDDGNAGFAQLVASPVQGADEIGIARTAVVADVSFGDIDGDGLDEIVLGGLTNIASGGGCQEFGHLLIALDDKTGGMAPLGTRFFNHFFRGCPSFSAWRLRYLHINTVDLDGDNIAEIQANQFIYDNFKNSAPWTEIHTLPEASFFEVNDFGFFDKSTSAMEAGDVTGDGRQNIVFYNQNYNEMSVWGDDQVNGWSNVASIPVQFANAQNGLNPIIVPVNLDTDGPVLKYSDAEYRFVFTEPVLIAALAAAPCARNIGQQLDDCRTSYGTARTVSVDSETSLTLSAGVHVGAKGGVNVFGIGAEIEAVKSTTVALTASVLAAYSLEQSVVFTSGPLEDSVIFTTIPLDQYTYTIVSHPVPELVGQQIVISLPRKPITLMTDLDFYNQSIASDGLRIGANVFQHTPGNPASYPSEADKNRLTQQYFDNFFEIVQNPSSALLDALGILKLESDPQSVDQGTGFREVTLRVNQAFGVGVGVDISRELRVTGEATGSVAGFTVGASVGSNLKLTKSDSTIYAGSVGSIDASNFAANSYNYGLFAYTYTDGASAQEFEVINYWVERTGQ